MRETKGVGLVRLSKLAGESDRPIDFKKKKKIKDFYYFLSPLVEFLI